MARKAKIFRASTGLKLPRLSKHLILLEEE